MPRKKFILLRANIFTETRSFVGISDPSCDLEDVIFPVSFIGIFYVDAFVSGKYEAHNSTPHQPGNNFNIRSGVT